MNIAIYTQGSKRSVFLESLVEFFISKGHKVFFISNEEKSEIHSYLENTFSVSTYAISTKIRKFPIHELIQAIKLSRLFEELKITRVYSHLQLPNISASLLGRMTDVKVFPCRHHADINFLYKNNTKLLLIDKIATMLSHKMIVVSEKAKQTMIQREGANENKVKVIRLGYYFNRYGQPNEIEVDKIKSNLRTTFTLIIISRMVQFKRHFIAIDVLKKLRDKGLDVGLIVLDGGPEYENIKDKVNKLELTSFVYFAGFQNSVINFLAAADLIIHPSLDDSSNQVVKEGSIVGVPAIVCNEVGDFNEYFINNQNGFLVEKDKPENEMVKIVEEFYYKKGELKQMANNLKKTVLQRFDINKVGEEYLNLN